MPPTTPHAPTQSAVERYVADFETFQANHPASPWLTQVRREAIERFQKLGFPTVRDEEWKYTDITPVANLAVTPIFTPNLNGAAATISQNFPFREVCCHRLTFVNGHFAPELSKTNHLPEGVEAMSLAEALGNHNEVVQENFGKSLDQNEVFTALNTAFAQDGAFIKIGSNVDASDRPIHLIFLSHGEEASVSHPRNLILVGDGAKATIIETYAATGESVYLTNSITEVVTGQNSHLEHIKVQTESEKAFHVGTLQIGAARDSWVRSTCVNFGGRIVRNNSNAVMGDQGCEVTLNGLVVGKDAQHVDNHTVMDHAQPHCLSHENYAHVLDDHSTGVFNGKIFVRLDAQKTDAKQSNRSLLLSRDATINAKPQLEILADDVKCTHGATIGQLDDDALFYLRARGVPEKAARNILIRAFANEVIDNIPVEDLRDKLEAMLLERLR